MKNRTKKFLLILAVGALIALAGCGNIMDDGSNDSTDEAQEISEDVDADVSLDSLGASYWFEIGITESNQEGLVRAQPPFEMEESLERDNLIERYRHLNDRSNQHHVYMMSHDGKVISYQVAQGKVSSVNSKLTNDVQIVRAQNCNFDGSGGAGGAEGSCFKTVESPQMDGSYGENGDAIFFFTPQGHYVEWNGLYVVSEEPLEITTEVTLVELEGDEDDVGPSGNSTNGNSGSNGMGNSTAP